MEKKKRYPLMSYAHFTLNRKVQVGTKDSFGTPTGHRPCSYTPTVHRRTRICKLGSKGFGEQLEHRRQRVTECSRSAIPTKS